MITALISKMGNLLCLFHEFLSISCLCLDGNQVLSAQGGSGVRAGRGRHFVSNQNQVIYLISWGNLISMKLSNLFMTGRSKFTNGETITLK